MLAHGFARGGRAVRRSWPRCLPSRPPSRWAQVNHIWHPDTLSFHESPSALRLDKPFYRDASGAFRLSFVVEPIVSDARDSSNWASVMLGGSSASSGFVANADIDFGFLVRSNGGLSIFDNDPRIMGLLNFGLWLDESPYAIPQAMAAERAIGNELLRR